MTGKNFMDTGDDNVDGYASNYDIDDEDESLYDEIDDELDPDELDDDDLYDDDDDDFDIDAEMEPDSFDDDLFEDDMSEARRDIWSNIDWDKD